MTAEAFPAHVAPMLATSAASLPADEGGWAYELKWDGVRAVAYLHDGGLRLESRNGNDITGRYPEMHGLAGACPGHDMVLDGEVVAFDEEGRPSFGLLQTRMHVAGERAVAARVGRVPIAYLIFDLLHLDGRSTRELPWHDRRRLLEDLELAGPGWQTPGSHPPPGAPLLEATRQRGLEGLVAKRVASPYVPGRRTHDWLKIKNVRRQEVVLGGWLPGEGNRTGRLGALLAGYYDEDGGLRFAGKVGTGFTEAELVRLDGLLSARARPTSPFADRVPYRAARFVEPELVAEVAFTEWTHTGTLRHPSYKGLRDDKPPQKVRRES